MDYCRKDEKKCVNRYLLVNTMSEFVNRAILRLVVLFIPTIVLYTRGLLQVWFSCTVIILCAYHYQQGRRSPDFRLA